VPTLVVDVVRGDPADRAPRVDRRREQAEQRAREQAEARAKELAGKVDEIRVVLDDTQRMLRKGEWERLRERRDKLNELFAPLDALVVRGGGGDALPAELAKLRARFEQQSQKLQAFEDRAFEVAFAATRGEKSTLEATAKKLKLSPEYLEAIYAEHAEQLEARLSAAEAARRAQAEAKQNALVAKCGPLPTRAYAEVKAYLAAMARSVRVRTELRECLTPRLGDGTCWSVVCNFDEITPGELTDQRTAHTWTFHLRQAKITGHVERALD
jgi:hypothetical protein